jgi:outer membrane protein
MTLRWSGWIALTAAMACGMPAYSQAGPPVQLNLRQAEDLALKNHPQVLAAQNEVGAMGQMVVEAKAPYYPALEGDVTGSGANHDARIGAGFLTDSRLFNRFGQGITLSQLITDSGRTPNLVASARLHEGAAQQNYQATRYDVLERVNEAYFGVLRAQATVRVAQQTVNARQLLVDQITALATNKLRSQLDVTFVAVNLSEAKLLLIQSQDQLQQANAELTRAIGSQQPATYTVAEEALPGSPPLDVDQLVTQALSTRPELTGLRLESEAAYRFERAERALSYPTVNFIGVGGYMPYIDQLTLPRSIPGEYAGAAVNVQIPVFNGHLYSARRQAAHYRAMEADQRLRDEQQAVVRDVRAAWASATTAFQRLAVAAQFLGQATMSLSLAQGRYDIGLASIVELTQAQLNLTQAQIENLSAKYDYQTRYAMLQYTLGALR